jgi:oligopeptide/dipeptide ABC transporter ATP-binding protein
MSSERILEVADLVVELNSAGHRVRPVDGISLSLGAGEIMGLVGESGSGKTLACRAIAGLLPAASDAHISGRIDIARTAHGHDSTKRGDQWHRDIAMIFQNPSSYLDPLMPVWRQIAEPLIFNEGSSTSKARTEAISLMKKVGIPDPTRNARAYPHQLSGGMKQRVMIAAALACRPKLLLADEPTTALDVTVQMQILHLLLSLRRESGLSIILVSHDLAVIGAICDSVNVMYCGKIVEQGPCETVLSSPAHPYARALIHSSPAWEGQVGELEAIPGQLPPLHMLPSGCRFHPRCQFAVEQCRLDTPALRGVVHEHHRSACFRAEKVIASHDALA